MVYIRTTARGLLCAALAVILVAAIFGCQSASDPNAPPQQTGAGAAPEEGASFVRFDVSDDASIYIKIKDDELYFSDNPQGLQVSSITGTTLSVDEMDFTEFVLPLPADSLTDGLDNISLHLVKSGLSTEEAAFHRVHGEVSYNYTDDSGEWAYIIGFSSTLTDTIDEAPVVFVPDIQNIVASQFTARPKEESRDILIGVKLEPVFAPAASELPSDAGVIYNLIKDIAHNGDTDIIEARVYDPAGKLISEGSGDLEKFGFT